MHKLTLVAACMLGCVGQTQIVSAQSVSSGMMSGSYHYAKPRNSPDIRVATPERPRAVASTGRSDPATTGSIAAKPKN
jgi:hypothetical protein